ncbi:3'-5' exonuclease [Marinobacter adhaerens]|uniref:DNA-directed DNA polymerase n=1 Tax=Marinobacter adhaerens TaxID=1033846 RepID=A0A851HTS7_9GAMM|nr:MULTISPECIES: 3'-5' exonuclease [Marinobacter]NWN90896.1 3'-5' exonuclease [Marinobacter adhaerens]
MLKKIRQWVKRHRATSTSTTALDNMPNPKSPGEQLLSDCRLVVLDLETTGLNASKDEVIAIGAVAITGSGIRLSDQFDLILKRPELDISETVLIHGIGPEALTHGHETEEALRFLLEWMNGDPILAYNSAFDQKFLEKTLKAELGYTRHHTWIDVAELLPTLFPDSPTGGRSLDHWADFFGLEISARHHAASDAMVTAELTLIALKKAQSAKVKTLAQLHDKLRYRRRLTRIHSV